MTDQPDTTPSAPRSLVPVTYTLKRLAATIEQLTEGLEAHVTAVRHHAGLTDSTGDECPCPPNCTCCPVEPADPVALDEQPACCVCGGGPVVYRNYREQPFCWPCADCQCAQNPCVRTGVNDPAVSADAAAAAEQPVRHTADTITDDLLDELYARAEQAEAERDKACTAFNAKVMQLEQAKRNQLGDAETISYWTSQTTLARDHSYWADRARASTILQARRWAARARIAEATLERLEARIDAVLEPQEPTP
ncbi:hypothetical protein [Streptomyces xanthophaeus]|uniref:hypothetical protein n=1 Tax=Streptomyces xanthophaeus TaxID=67385 RepID=UPI002647DBDA|nr:hypothetical protein [Streptomyces xanthophaeus]WKD36535.1 hypothetical protein KO717_34445 [Streptomyces xanthophaeus]